MFNPEQVTQILRAQQAVVAALKQRFPNMSTEETTQLASNIVQIVLVEVAR